MKEKNLIELRKIADYLRLSVLAAFVKAAEFKDGHYSQAVFRSGSGYSLSAESSTKKCWLKYSSPEVDCLEGVYLNKKFLFKLKTEKDLSRIIDFLCLLRSGAEFSLGLEVK